MELGVYERLLLLDILEHYEGNITNARIVKDLRFDKFGFTEEEHKNLQIRFENGVVKWRSEFDKSEDIEIGPVGISIIMDELKKLSRIGKIKQEHISLYDKFVGE